MPHTTTQPQSKTKLHGITARASYLQELLARAHLPTPSEVWVTTRGAFISMSPGPKGKEDAEKVASFFQLAGLPPQVSMDDPRDGGAFYVSVDWEPAQAIPTQRV